MDIAALATDMKQMELANQVGVAVARKGMDAAKQAGEAAIALIQSAAELQAASTADVDGRGAAVDVRG